MAVTPSTISKIEYGEVLRPSTVKLVDKTNELVNRVNDLPSNLTFNTWTTTYNGQIANSNALDNLSRVTSVCEALDSQLYSTKFINNIYDGSAGNPSPRYTPTPSGIKLAGRIRNPTGGVLFYGWALNLNLPNDMKLDLVKGGNQSYPCVGQLTNGQVTIIPVWYEGSASAFHAQQACNFVDLSGIFIPYRYKFDSE